MRDLALPLRVTVEQGIHHDGAARVREKLAPQADEAAAGDAEFDTDAAVAVIVHVGDFTFARAELLHDYADEFFRDIDREMLDRFHQLSVDSLRNNFGL